MSESVRDLLVRGIAAAKAQEKEEARFYLEWALRLDPDVQQCIDAWFWLSEVSEDPEEKRGYLEEVLARQPNFYPARRSLAILDGRLNPEDIIDPDHLPSPLTAERPIETNLFVCSHCGGQLTYSPDGKALICEHCNQTQPLVEGNPKTAGIDKDFSLTLATARGHTHAIAMRSFECEACGASFVLSPTTLSITCPYCASVYVTQNVGFRELIPPDGIIPFAIDRKIAERRLKTWLVEHKLGNWMSMVTVHGLYLPVWKFRFSCTLPWEIEEDLETHPDTQKGTTLLSYDDILVVASHAFPALWPLELETYPLNQLVAYQASYLADWPAETYQISLSDASLDARLKAIERSRLKLAHELSVTVDQIKIDTAPLIIESYQLILLPVWLAHFQQEGKRRINLINGVTGALRGEAPPREQPSFLSRIV